MAIYVLVFCSCKPRYSHYGLRGATDIHEFNAILISIAGSFEPWLCHFMEIWPCIRKKALEFTFRKSIDTQCHAPFQRKGNNNIYGHLLHKVIRGRAHDLGNRFIHNEAMRNDFWCSYSKTRNAVNNKKEVLKWLCFWLNCCRRPSELVNLART